jgi:hypothetical protein
MSWITILLPLLLEFFAKCREIQDKDEILERIQSSGKARKLAILRSVKIACEANGWLEGLSGKAKRRYLKNARKEANAEFAKVGTLQLAMMIDGAEVAYQASVRASR